MAPLYSGFAPSLLKAKGLVIRGVDLDFLATSAWLAIEADDLALGRETACSMILEGYSAGLEGGGRDSSAFGTRPLATRCSDKQVA